MKEKHNYHQVGPAQQQIITRSVYNLNEIKHINRKINFLASEEYVVPAPSKLEPTASFGIPFRVAKAPSSHRPDSRHHLTRNQNKQGPVHPPQSSYPQLYLTAITSTCRSKPQRATARVGDQSKLETTESKSRDDL
jgi:hypothetical protein